METSPRGTPLLQAPPFFYGYTILLKRFADSAKNFSAKKNLGIFLTYFVYLLQRDLYYLWPV